MTHPLDKHLGPTPQHECHWSHHDGQKMVYDFMCLLPLSKSDAVHVIQILNLAVGVIARSSGVDATKEGE